MNHDNSMTSFVDLMAILLIAFMMITVLLVVKMAHKESLALVDLAKTKLNNAQTINGTGETILYLTINAKKIMTLEGQMIPQDKLIKDVQELAKTLKALSPSKIYLRIDRNIPTGTALELLTTCQDQGILSYLVTSEKKGG
jgi:biopolymer transport protein ExbD